MSTVSFSVIITAHNHRAYIAEAVESALRQTYSARDIIVVDDASTDGMQDLLDRYGDSITPVFLASNHGGSAAHNAGARIARGEYLIFLDGDDVLLPWTFEVYRRIILAENRPALLLA